MATKMEPHRVIKKIIIDFQRHRRDTDKKIKLLNMKIARLQKMVEKNIIQNDNPDEYEIKAIKDFESKKKKGKLEFVPLDSLN